MMVPSIQCITSILYYSTWQASTSQAYSTAQAYSTYILHISIIIFYLFYASIYLYIYIHISKAHQAMSMAGGVCVCVCVCMPECLSVCLYNSAALLQHSSLYECVCVCVCACVRAWVRMHVGGWVGVYRAISVARMFWSTTCRVPCGM